MVVGSLPLPPPFIFFCAAAQLAEKEKLKEYSMATQNPSAPLMTYGIDNYTEQS